MAQKDSYLVPFDFTSITESALQHALQIASVCGGEVVLLHIVKAEKEKATALTKLEEVAKTATNPNQIELRAVVVVGSIFEDIGKFAEELEAQLIVMGTHGAKGLQKIFGSYAIRVITSSSTPFVVVQKELPKSNIHRIVMPVNLTKESVQVMKFAVDLAKKFDAEIHLLGEAQSDPWFKNKMKGNILVAHKYFDKSGIQSKVAILKGDKSYEQEVLEYGQANNSDLYAVAYFSESLLPQFDTFAQNMITNDSGTPVLIVNAQAIMQNSAHLSFIAV